MCFILMVTSGCAMADSLTINQTTDNDSCHAAEVWTADPPTKVYYSPLTGGGSVGHFYTMWAVIYESSFRFPGVTIPKGSTISNATITFYQADVADYNGADMTIYGFDEDDSAMAANWDAFVAKADTTASVAWTVAHSAGISRTTPNISSIIEEIVARSGWSSGNAIQIHFQDDTYDLDTGSNPGNFGIKLATFDRDSVHNVSISITYTLPYQDVGLRVYDGSGVIKIAGETLDGHKLRFRQGATTYGIPLGTPGEASDSGVRVYDGSAVKCLKEY